jgi:nicotinate-nucleotide pyrophosphorylase (carboxylating)
VIGVDRTPVTADLVAREALVVFGVAIAREVFRRVDPEIAIDVRIDDGGRAAAGDVVLVASGPADPILRAERTALNFMQRLSGVATMASRFAEAVAGTGARVVDTRKTTPGYRVLEKAAVLAGGAHNHRADLGSGILIKDNHIAACGSVTAAVERARARAPHPLRIEVEVETEAELDEALAASADIVLLDNMTVEQVSAAVERAHAAGVLVEVSGGITLETAGDYARAGADVISSGAITHSAGSVDLALDFRAR